MAAAYGVLVIALMVLALVSTARYFYVIGYRNCRNDLERRH